MARRKADTDTKKRIMDVMAGLIQRRGYSAVSYQDISEAIGIRKASIHYHFPSKADLGVAVIRDYADSLLSQIDAATAGGNQTPEQMLDAYMQPYRDFRGEDERICLCGALAGEFYALPEAMQSEVSRFFGSNQAWLEKLFADNPDSFQLPGTPAQAARLFFDALQGAVLAKRAAGDDSQIDDVVASLKALVTKPS